MKYLGLSLMAVAGVIFYFAFFCLAPAASSAIPAGAWQHFVQIIVYIVIAYFGGIGIPLVLLIGGLIIFIANR